MLRVSILLLSVFVAIMGCTSGSKVRITPYIIGQNCAWESLNLYGKENNVTGFSDDLLLEVSRVEGISMQVVTTSLSPVVTLLEQEGIDAVLSALTPNDKTKKKYEFSEPYFILGPVLVVRKDAPYTNLEQMKAKDVGFERGNAWALNLANTTDAVFLPYDDMLPAFEDLQKGSLDAVVADAVVAYRLVGGVFRGALKIAGPPITPQALRLVVEKGKNEELITHFNHGLEAIKKNGLYSKILHYWGLFDALDPTSAFYEGQPEY